MTKLIGLMDYDVIRTRHYHYPNYDIGLVYAYLKDDKNINVRLISSPSLQNLQQYDIIYVFKQSRQLPHPSSVIRDYYKLPIEEYGPGFQDKPLRPYLLETKYILPDCSCYNNMILYSLEHPKAKIAWKISKSAKGGKYKPIRLFEDFEGETLHKDYPTSRYNIVYDDPLDLILNKSKWSYFNELLESKHKFVFAHSLDISQVSDTNILEQILDESKYASLRHNLVATSINQTMIWLMNYVIEKQCFSKIHKIIVTLPMEEGLESCFETLLQINYYYHKSKFQLYLRPVGSTDLLYGFDLALLAYRYLQGKPDKMSYYEYVFNIAYLRAGAPKHLIHTGEDRYEYIMKNYGTAPTLVVLEKWIQRHPELEEAVFIGGSSDYGKQRKEYYDERRSGFNVGASIENISTERGS